MIVITLEGIFITFFSLPNWIIVIQILRRPQIHTIFNISLACMCGLFALFIPFTVHFYLQVLQGQAAIETSSAYLVTDQTREDVTTPPTDYIKIGDRVHGGETNIPDTWGTDRNIQNNSFIGIESTTKGSRSINRKVNNLVEKEYIDVKTKKVFLPGYVFDASQSTSRTSTEIYSIPSISISTERHSTTRPTARKRPSTSDYKKRRPTPSERPSTTPSAIERPPTPLYAEEGQFTPLYASKSQSTPHSYTKRSSTPLDATERQTTPQNATEKSSTPSRFAERNFTPTISRERVAVTISATVGEYGSSNLIERQRTDGEPIEERVSSDNDFLSAMGHATSPSGGSVQAKSTSQPETESPPMSSPASTVRSMLGEKGFQTTAKSDKRPTKDEVEKRRRFACARFMELRNMVGESMKLISSNVMFRCFYILYADRGLVIRGMKNTKLLNISFVLLTLVMMLYSYLSWPGMVMLEPEYPDNTVKGRICLGNRLDYDRDNSKRTSDIYIKPRVMVLILTTMYGSLYYYLVFKVRRFVNLHCPGNRANMGGTNRRNLLTFSETSALLFRILFYFVWDTILIIILYALQDSLGSQQVFYIYFVHGAVFDLYCSVYLPYKWLYLSRERYPQLWAKSTLTNRTDKQFFMTSFSRLEPRRYIFYYRDDSFSVDAFEMGEHSQERETGQNIGLNQNSGSNRNKSVKENVQIMNNLLKWKKSKSIRIVPTEKDMARKKRRKEELNQYFHQLRAGSRVEPFETIMNK